jgi:hypothetical protein
MQMMPATFKQYADSGWDIKNPEHNLRSGIRFIKDLYGKFGGDERAVAASYYGGPKAGVALQQGKVYRDLKNPNAPDTAQYADQVIGRMVNKAPVKVNGVEVGIPVNPVKTHQELLNEKIHAYMDKPVAETQYTPVRIQVREEVKDDYVHPLWRSFVEPMNTFYRGI